MSYAPWERWQRSWQATAEAVEKRNGEIRAFKIEGPARLEEVEGVEGRLGRAIPQSLRNVLLEFSRRVDFDWYLPDDITPPDELSEIFSGECGWDLHELESREETRQDWVKECFPNQNDTYDRIWHDKLGWYDVPNGDCIAFDTKRNGEPIVYLSHEDGEGHGYVLGANFADYIDRLTRLACAGAEDWQWIIFCPNATNGLDPDGARAKQWRSWLGLTLPTPDMGP